MIPIRIVSLHRPPTFTYTPPDGGGEGGGAGAAIPAFPYSFAVTQAGDTELNLTWRLQDSLDQWIKIERSADNAAWTQVAIVSGGWRTWTDRSLDAVQSAFYRISAFSSGGVTSGTTAVTSASSGTTAASSANAGNAITGFSASGSTSYSAIVRATTPASPVGTAVRLVFERSTDGGVTYELFPGCMKDISSNPTAYVFTDTPLLPNTQYTYRARILASTAYGAYTSGATITTPALSAGWPYAPSGVTVTVDSATQATVRWIDTNAGGAQYRIQTAQVHGSGTPELSTFSTVATTASGATSQTIVTAGKTTLYVRVAGLIGSFQSAFTSVNIPGGTLKVNPPSSGSGGNVYHIGPGEAYTALSGFIWNSLQPGDTLFIHYNGDLGYAEKILINCRGTAAAPINIVGVPSSGGLLPVISGLNASTGPQFTISYHGAGNFWEYALVFFHKLVADPTGHQPGYINFCNFHVKNQYAANSPNTFKDELGASGTILGSAAGIYIGSGDNITVSGCIITNCNNGMFWAHDSTDIRDVNNIFIQGNWIYGNHTAGGSSEHSIYGEGKDVTYRWNFFGPPRATGAGAQIKDRGIGTKIYGNIISGSIRLIDLVESQNGVTRYYMDPRFRITYVYDNILVNTGGSSTIVHYGEDQGTNWYSRKGYLFFTHNTLYTKVAQATLFRQYWFYVNSKADVVVANNNIFYTDGIIGDSDKPDLYFISNNGPTGVVGIMDCGPNWVSTDWLVTRTDHTFTGIQSGTSGFVVPVGNDPAFVGPSSGNFTLGAGSTALGIGGRLPLDHPPVNTQLVLPAAQPPVIEARNLSGVGSDAGAKETS